MKYILKVAKEDDAIFKKRFVISKPKSYKVELVRLTKSMNTTEKERELTKALLRQGWKLVEDE